MSGWQMSGSLGGKCPGGKCPDHLGGKCPGGKCPAPDIMGDVGDLHIWLQLYVDC